ncbi:PREDICTED: uncharacterized protein LOC106821536 isoform X2 [Priapulus caudatus]|uniref:Uncharacterized protein LOC106821536 isoform X2 n=1 Tax=Priapulus caudatus TaxID=37621 RepID=A0ABM1FBQ4_PRICU|nr:PREDICTED: uncharacterized protein LOC106821536 isoform X2 [Priapulus caudatus]
MWRGNEPLAPGNRPVCLDTVSIDTDLDPDDLDDIEASYTDMQGSLCDSLTNLFIDEDAGCSDDSSRDSLTNVYRDDTSLDESSLEAAGRRGCTEAGRGRCKEGGRVEVGREACMEERREVFVDDRRAGWVKEVKSAEEVRGAVCELSNSWDGKVKGMLGKEAMQETNCHSPQHYKDRETWTSNDGSSRGSSVRLEEGERMSPKRSLDVAEFHGPGVKPTPVLIGGLVQANLHHKEGRERISPHRIPDVANASQLGDKKSALGDNIVQKNSLRREQGERVSPQRHIDVIDNVELGGKRGSPSEAENTRGTHMRLEERECVSPRGKRDMANSPGSKRSPSLAESLELDRLLVSFGEQSTLNIENSSDTPRARESAHELTRPHLTETESVSGASGRPLQPVALRKPFGISSGDLEEVTQHLSAIKRRSLTLELGVDDVGRGLEASGELPTPELARIRREMWSDLADIIGEEQAQMLKWACETDRKEEKAKETVDVRSEVDKIHACVESSLVSLKRDLEGWREILLPCYAFVTWEQKYFAGIIMGIVSIVFLMLWYFEPTILTTVALFALFLCIVDYVVPLAASNIFDSDNWTGEKEKKYEQVCERILHVRDHTTCFFTMLADLKQNKPKIYFVSVMGALAAIAWIGNTIPNLFLTYVIVSFLVMLPGLRESGIMQEMTGKVLGMVQQTIGGKKKSN